MDPGASKTQASLVGGTWADPTERATFHQRLNDVNVVLAGDAFNNIKGNVTITATADASALKIQRKDRLRIIPRAAESVRQ